MAIDLMTAGGAVLEETTATASDILKGKTANDGEGEQITGTLELTGDAGAGEVLSGKTFYTTNPKSKQTGAMRNNGRWPDADKFTLEGNKIWMYKQDGYTEGGLGVAASTLGNAQAEHVLSGVSASSANGLGFGGSMPNRSGWSATIAPGGYANIPAGYHDGSTGVSARSVNGNDAVALVRTERVTGRYVYNSSRYMLGVVQIGPMHEAYGAYHNLYIDENNHRITWGDIVPPWWIYAYIQL